MRRSPVCSCAKRAGHHACGGMKVDEVAQAHNETAHPRHQRDEEGTAADSKQTADAVVRQSEGVDAGRSDHSEAEVHDRLRRSDEGVVAGDAAAAEHMPGVLCAGKDEAVTAKVYSLQLRTEMKIANVKVSVRQISQQS